MLSYRLVHLHRGDVEDLVAGLALLLEVVLTQLHPDLVLREPTVNRGLVLCDLISRDHWQDPVMSLLTG